MPQRAWVSKRASPACKICTGFSSRLDEDCVFNTYFLRVRVEPGALLASIVKAQFRDTDPWPILMAFEYGAREDIPEPPDEPPDLPPFARLYHL